MQTDSTKLLSPGTMAPGPPERATAHMRAHVCMATRAKAAHENARRAGKEGSVPRACQDELDKQLEFRLKLILF